MSLGGKLSSQRSTDSATRSSDHNNFSGHGSRLGKTDLDKFLGEMGSLRLYLLCEFLLLSWNHYNFWWFLNLTLDKIPIIAEPHPLCLNGDPSPLRNRR